MRHTILLCSLFLTSLLSCHTTNGEFHHPSTLIVLNPHYTANHNCTHFHIQHQVTNTQLQRNTTRYINPCPTTCHHQKLDISALLQQ